MKLFQQGFYLEILLGKIPPIYFPLASRCQYVIFILFTRDISLSYKYVS